MTSMSAVSTPTTHVGVTRASGSFARKDFRGREGELRYQTFDQAGASNDITVISGDINGDRVADFEIEIVGILQFTSGDFLL
jgi:hypothetical protein